MPMDRVTFTKRGMQEVYILWSPARLHCTHVPGTLAQGVSMQQTHENACTLPYPPGSLPQLLAHVPPQLLLMPFKGKVYISLATALVSH